MVLSIISKVVIFVGMFFMTIGALQYLQENGKEVQVSEVVTRRYLTNAACVAIAVITVAYDVLSVYIFLKV